MATRFHGVRRLDRWVVDVPMLPVARRDERDITGLQFVIHEILDELLEQPLRVERQRRGRRGELGISGPAVLLIGRRVRDNRADVVSLIEAMTMSSMRSTSGFDVSKEPRSERLAGTSCTEVTATSTPLGSG
jgi:hypothetical protein